ncbi:hypothetical protein GQL56_17805 [Pseudomonas putida]|nr:hypothetical protein [Pseudomonas putida]
MNQMRKVFIGYMPWVLVSLLVSGCSGLGVETSPEKQEGAVLAIPGCSSTGTENFANYIRPGWELANEHNAKEQRFVIASDPQPFRVMVTRNPYSEKVDEDRWKTKAGMFFDLMSAVGRQVGDSYVPLIVNGDMTDYGHGNEREVMRTYMKKAATADGPLMFPGLGNHDYDNNVGDCGNNGCARDAVCDHLTWVKTLSASVPGGFNFDYAWDASEHTHSGSFSYSFNVGKVHVVQLNNEPTYTRSFSTGWPTKTYFEVRNSWAWLEADLRAAREKNLFTIVNMHKNGDWQEEPLRRTKFKDLIEKYGVVSVFAGHYHSLLGSDPNIGRVPAFQTGAMLAQSYLTVLFDWQANVLRVNALADHNVVESRNIPLPTRVMLKDVNCEVRTELDQRTAADAFCSSASSAKGADVQKYVRGSSLCFESSDGAASRCYSSLTKDDFTIPDFDDSSSVDKEVEVIATGGPLKGKLANVIHKSARHLKMVVDLYTLPDFKGDTCRLTLLPEDIVSFETEGNACYPMSTVIGGSMRVSNFQGGLGDRLTLYSPNGGRGYKGSYDGDFEITNFEKVQDLPEGLIATPVGLRPSLKRIELTRR